MAKPLDVTLETDIRKPVGEVWAFIQDCRNDPKWIGGIQSAKMVTPEPFGPGSKVSRIAKFLGKKIPYVTEVVDYEAERLIHMKADKPFEMIVTYELRPLADGTRVIVRNQGEASGFFGGLAAPFIAKAMAKNIGKDVVRLKQIMEAQ